VYSAAIKHGVEVLGEVELACRTLTQKCIGITGTNGKTTVTLLVEHILNFTGKKARALGNVGVPITQEIVDSSLQDNKIVCELSSFQLETMRSKVLDAAVVLNITPDHLERYSNMEEYAKAKIRIFDCLKPSALELVFEPTLKEFKSLFKHQTYTTYGYHSGCDYFIDKEEIKLRGQSILPIPTLLHGVQSHDVENQVAAYAICRHFGVTPHQFIEGLKTFKKPSHRIEYVTDINGVAYYDDSKGTNIDAVLRAVGTFQSPLILIAGGVDKGFPYTSWIQPFKGKVKLICAIGQSKQLIQQQLHEHFPIKVLDTLENAVAYAHEQAVKGDTVLLSPGCSSYDMFRDYKERGDLFQKCVLEIAKRHMPNKE
jgi:UDP-N-acetylmuramoylalanine--D-glutamate ligase